MSRKILIVEDEEKIARFVELELVHEGYEVIKAQVWIWHYQNMLI